MNSRLTPLNIISSILLVSIAWLVIYPDQKSLHQLGTIPLIVFFILCSISDLVFRRLIQNLKRIWLFELLFLIFVVILTVLIKTQFN